MIRGFILKRLDSVERQLGESVDYIRHIVRVSLRAFFKFARILPLSRYRRVLPQDSYHVARIVATRDEDCGTCVQVEVNLTLQDGVSTEVLRAVLDRRPDQLRDDLADTYHFTEEVVTATGNEGQLREKLRKRYGEEGLVELALAIATCRVFPITKRALGYAKSCSEVQLRLDKGAAGSAIQKAGY